MPARPAKKKTAARRPSLSRDPAPIAEIRRIRAKMWREGGGTIEGLMALVSRQATDSKPATPVLSKRRRAA